MKLRNLKHSAFLLVLSLVVFGFALTGWAGPPVPIHSKQLEPQLKPIKVERLSMKTDLKVQSLNSAHCLCYNDLSAVNAMLIKGLDVSIENMACTGGQKMPSPQGMVKVAYYDMTSGSLVTKTKPFSFPSGRAYLSVHVVTGSILVKKSTGIKAEVTLNPPGQDCNMSNNIKTIHQCPVYIVQ